MTNTTPNPDGESQPKLDHTGSPHQNTPNAIEIATGIFVSQNVLQWSFSRSSGPGGQNVNKVNSKATLRICVQQLVETNCISHTVAARLRILPGVLITSDDDIILSSDTSRSQIQNRKHCLSKLGAILQEALKPPPKKRKRRKPSKRAIQRRIDRKKQRGEIKQKRRRPRLND